MKYSFIIGCLTVSLYACNNAPVQEATTPASNAENATGSTEKTQIVPDSKPLPELPHYVVYKNWEMGNPDHVKIVSDVYQAWDSDNPKDMTVYFADSTAFDFPDGRRVYTTKQDAEKQFRKWRGWYKHTSNLSFSLISLHNKDQDQDWVIAWTWNKWQDDTGKKDSMLYCDNWRIKDNKIVYLNSLQQKPSKTLARTLNSKIPE